MCGICGFVNLSATRQDASVLQNMVSTMHHRGPDSQGFFEDKKSQVFLGHARLSIIDISDNGKQPMHLGCLTIVLNGEIYNFKEIKDELKTKGHTFKSTSDTEVALHAFQEWGESCVERFVGMYAFAIYDSEKKILALFRDRAGVKPLYYYFDGRSFIFGSELKVFHQNPLFHKELDFDALGLYMKFGYIPTPYCVFKNTHKLVQGSYLIFDINSASYGIHQYWDLKSLYLKPKLKISYEEALEETERLLFSAFNYRMVSDVPVGVFLSAGYDSSCVASLLQKGMTDKLRTFTIGFEFGNNEAPMAKEIARYLGTNHSEYYCTEVDALNIVKDLPFFFDEPFADDSAIPTKLVSTIARKQVKVALSADGGDEIFAGYNSYDYYLRSEYLTNHIPHFLRKTTGCVIRSLSCLAPNPKTKKRISIISDVMSSDKEVSLSLTESLINNEFNHIHQSFFTKQYSEIPTVYQEGNEGMTLLSKLLYSDYVQYMQDDVLVKVDRASMSASLEGRNPFLDQRVIEFVALLPDEYKYYHGVKKRILKDIVYKYVPRHLIDKPKTGFSVPLARWLDNGLKEYADYHLSENRIKLFDVLDNKFVNNILAVYKKGDTTLAPDIWKILQLQMWCDKWLQ